MSRFSLPLPTEPSFCKYWLDLPPGRAVGKVWVLLCQPVRQIWLRGGQRHKCQRWLFTHRKKEMIRKVIRSMRTRRQKSLKIRTLFGETCSHCVSCMFYAPCVISPSVMSRGCKYAPDFILQTRIPINEHTHRCPHWESGRVWVREALPVIKPIFRGDWQHIIILVSLSLVITRHSP